MNAVTAYLEYLREMARKIAYRGTFLNVLYRKARRASERYMDWDIPHAAAEMQRYLAAADQDAHAQEGRTLFIGIGLIAGKLGGTGAVSIVSAPLLLVPVEVEPPDDTNSDYRHDPQWKAVSINYDLITALLDTTNASDADDALGQPNLIAPAASKAVHDLELVIDKLIDTPGISQRLLNPTFIEEVMVRLRCEIPAFRDRITDTPTAFRKDELRLVIDGKGLRWFNHRFAFMGSMPDSLSAYEALNQLCTAVRGTPL